MLIFTSCEKLFDYEGDCEVTHEIRFVYDMNLKWADAFPSEVKSVNLYVFDSNGLFIKEYSDRGEALTQPDYGILLDLPGNRTYRFLAWCGLLNEEDSQTSFYVPTPEAGTTTIEEMTASIKGALVKGEIVSEDQLQFLYHGYLETELPDNYDGSHYIYTIPLTKDTNHIRVMLQQVNGNLTPDEFEISLGADNGVLSWNNLPEEGSEVLYYPWNTDSDILGVGNAGENVSEYYGVIADLSTSRLMAEESNNIFLTVKSKEDGKLLFRVPMIQYFLTEKDYYEQAYGHKMSDQQFLDRQDEYFMTFFLDDNMQWLYAVINILEWRVIIKNYSNTN